MICYGKSRLFAAIPLVAGFAAFAQHLSSPALQQPIRVNVVVAHKSGIPVTDLNREDFTVLDNGDPRPITFFRLVTPAQEPVKLIIAMDEVNADYREAEMQRDGVDRFLRANGGKLEFPTSLALFTDTDTRVEPAFLTDGNTLAGALGHETLSLREIRRGTSFGDFDRVRMSLTALHKIAAAAAALSGRKIIFWISPGWPYLSDPRTFQIDAQIQSQVFKEIVALSTQIRRADITLYDIDPAAVEEMRATSYYDAFLKGVSKPGQVVIGDVALQVLALQSGGTVEQSSTDVNSMIQRCLRGLRGWYEIGFEPPPGDAPDMYHHVEVRIDKEHLKALTRLGYYSNPTANPER